MRPLTGIIATAIFLSVSVSAGENKGFEIRRRAVPSLGGVTQELGLNTKGNKGSFLPISLGSRDESEHSERALAGLPLVGGLTSGLTGGQAQGGKGPLPLKLRSTDNSERALAGLPLVGGLTSGLTGGQAQGGKGPLPLKLRSTDNSERALAGLPLVGGLTSGLTSGQGGLPLKRALPDVLGELTTTAPDGHGNNIKGLNLGPLQVGQKEPPSASSANSERALAGLPLVGDLTSGLTDGAGESGPLPLKRALPDVLGGLTTTAPDGHGNDIKGLNLGPLQLGTKEPPSNKARALPGLPVIGSLASGLSPSSHGGSGAAGVLAAPLSAIARDNVEARALSAVPGFDTLTAVTSELGIGHSGPPVVLPPSEERALGSIAPLPVGELTSGLPLNQHTSGKKILPFTVNSRGQHSRRALAGLPLVGGLTSGLTGGSGQPSQPETYGVAPVSKGQTSEQRRSMTGLPSLGAVTQGLGLNAQGNTDSLIPLSIPLSGRSELPSEAAAHFIKTVQDTTTQLSAAKSKVNDVFGTSSRKAKPVSKEVAASTFQTVTGNLRDMSSKLAQAKNNAKLASHKVAHHKVAHHKNAHALSTRDLTLSSLVSDLISTVNSLLQALEPALTQLLGKVLGAIADALEPLAGQLIQALDGLIQVIEDIVQNLADELTPALQPVLSLVQKLADGLNLNLGN
ncbi:hypothetical protein OC846_002536 [Tilletia horrida]|uniref:Uncharacterized protein n=1 Tax=Tilletia horrida TaxID=155126 RepID=A0AAN6GR21_9BASI|nr:hypothetical protein OC846_002536 [Tilletia horrida]KAK0554102.1 hypothetical protein OC845_000916 [Tilletia horrida]